MSLKFNGYHRPRTIPKFLQPKFRRDANKKKPGQKGYDPSTILIPPDQFRKLTDGMKRYWELKMNNMDKILLYRFGDWYVSYNEDLEICQKYLDTRVTPHPGKI